MAQLKIWQDITVNNKEHNIVEYDGINQHDHHQGKYITRSLQDFAILQN